MKGENFAPSNFWPALDVEGEVIPRIVLVHVPVLLTTKPDVWPRFDRQLRIRGIVAYVTGVNVLPFIDFGDPATGGHGSVFVDDLNLHFDGDGTDNFGKLHNVVCLAGCQKVKILVLLGGKLKELPMCNTAGQCCMIFRHDLACRARNS